MISIDFTQMITAEAKAAQAEADRDGQVAAAVQRHIDDLVKAWGYNDAPTLASYVGSQIPQWSGEALAFIQWRDAIWQMVYHYRENPEVAPRTIEELISQLPEIDRP